MIRNHPVFSDAMLRLLLDRTEAEADIVPITPADFYNLRMAIGSRLGKITAQRLNEKETVATTQHAETEETVREQMAVVGAIGRTQEIVG